MPFSHPAAPLVMELLSESISFYNLAWTILLVLCMVYWLSVIVGLADMDFLGEFHTLSAVKAHKLLNDMLEKWKLNPDIELSKQMKVIKTQVF